MGLTPRYQSPISHIIAIFPYALRSLLWSHCGPNAAFARSSSNLWQQVWEADGDIYWLSWLIICPARRSGELFGGSGELGEAVPDH